MTTGLLASGATAIAQQPCCTLSFNGCCHRVLPPRDLSRSTTFKAKSSLRMAATSATFPSWPHTCKHDGDRGPKQGCVTEAPIALRLGSLERCRVNAHIALQRHPQSGSGRPGSRRCLPTVQAAVIFRTLQYQISRRCARMIPDVACTLLIGADAQPTSFRIAPKSGVRCSDTPGTDGTAPGNGHRHDIPMTRAAATPVMRMPMKADMRCISPFVP